MIRKLLLAAGLALASTAQAQTAVQFGLKSHAPPYTVQAGAQLFYAIWLVTLGSDMQPVANQPVSIYSYPAGCGSFDGGGTQAQVTSNVIGELYVPTWTAANVTGSCLIVAEITGRPNSGISLDIHVIGGSMPVPTPPSGPLPPPPDDFPPNFVPVRTAAGGTPGGMVQLSLSSPMSTCSLIRARFTDSGIDPPPAAPAGLAAPYGRVEFTTTNCAVGQPTSFALEFPQPLPPTAQWWRYGPTADDRTRHWYPAPATVTGNRLTFSIEDGGFGDDDFARDGGVVGTGVLAVPGGAFQDVWWSGAIENGWGMSLVQHRDALFANLFAYDAQGNATWYVMPSGSWNDARTVYTGNLYLPKGAPFYAYDASKFDIGAAVGTMRLAFANANEASFEYTIDGVSGRKNITKILFGPVTPPLDRPLADLWWAGSAQNGWGIALLQQYSTLFALWFTYDANGKATWFVMPGGSWAAKGDYRGSIYKAVGPPWLGVQYDVSRHRTIESGTFRLRFSGEGASFDYTLDGKSGAIPLTRIPF